MNDEGLFSEKYDTSDSTESQPSVLEDKDVQDVFHNSDRTGMPNENDTIFSLAKPKRIIIRAKVIHD